MSTANELMRRSDREQAKGEYTSPGPRRRSRRERDAPRPGQRMRVFYFALSSVWGFAAGASSVSAAVRMSGTSVKLDLAALGLLAVGLVLSVAGGLMAAAAYREARRRAGR